LSLGRVTRGALWLSIGIILSSFFGFIYWVIVSKFINVEVIGLAAAVIGLEALIVSSLNLGIPIGVQRFMGSSYGKRDYSKLSEYFYSNMIFMFTTSLVAGLVFIFASIIQVNLFSLDASSLTFLEILIIAGMNGWSSIGESLCNVVVSTEYVA